MRPSPRSASDTRDAGGRCRSADLIELQLRSYEWFRARAARAVRRDLPITDFTGKNLELRFRDYEFGEPRYDRVRVPRARHDLRRALCVNVELHPHEPASIRRASLHGRLPDDDRTARSSSTAPSAWWSRQLVRSPGVYFTDEGPDHRAPLHSAKLIPNRGAWLEFETQPRTSSRSRSTASARSGHHAPARRRLRVQRRDRWRSSPTVDNGERSVHQRHARQGPGHDTQRGADGALQALRPGDPPTLENARGSSSSLLLQPAATTWQGRALQAEQEPRARGGPHGHRTAGRGAHPLPRGYRRRSSSSSSSSTTASGRPDDIDHLGNRRVRTVGELIQNAVPRRPAAHGARGQGAHDASRTPRRPRRTR